MYVYKGRHWNEIDNDTSHWLRLTIQACWDHFNQNTMNLVD